MNGQQPLLGLEPAGAPLATWSPCMRYRYTLRRVVMLNPSTADECSDDPTIRRCIDFATRWGYGELLIVYAWRSTDPRALPYVADPVGPANDDALRGACERAEIVVCAWGKHARRERVAKLEAVLGAHRAKLRALKFNKDGSPAHPLYLPATSPLLPFSWGGC